MATRKKKTRLADALCDGLQMEPNELIFEVAVALRDLMREHFPGYRETIAALEEDLLSKLGLGQEGEEDGFGPAFSLHLLSLCALLEKAEAQEANPCLGTLADNWLGVVN